MKSINKAVHVLERIIPSQSTSDGRNKSSSLPRPVLAESVGEGEPGQLGGVVGQSEAQGGVESVERSSDGHHTLLQSGHPGEQGRHGQSHQQPRPLCQHLGDSGVKYVWQFLLTSAM